MTSDVARLQAQANRHRRNPGRKPSTTRSVSNRIDSEAAGKEQKPVCDVANHGFERVPRRYSEALKCTNRFGYAEAMRDEIVVLESNDVWTIIKRLPRCNVRHCRCVFQDENKRAKPARLAEGAPRACGNEHIIGVGCLLTFAGVMDSSTVKVTLALAVV